MTVSRGRHGGLITTTDPTAESLRSVLRSDLASILAAERHREIASFVRRERSVAHAVDDVFRDPVRRSRGLRRAIAIALLALARRFAQDVVEPAC